MKKKVMSMCIQCGVAKDCAKKSSCRMEWENFLKNSSEREFWENHLRMAEAAPPPEGLHVWVPMDEWRSGRKPGQSERLF